MRLTVVGSSPAWPNPGGAQSGYLVEGPGRLLLDCGPGVLAKLRVAQAWPELDAIAISHFHLDHWGDLVPWVWGAKYGPGRELPPVELHLPPGGRSYLAGLAEQFGGQADMFDQAFDIREFAPGAPNAVAGFELVPVRLKHYSIETYGFRVSDGGATLAYSADSAPNGSLVELAPRRRPLPLRGDARGLGAGAARPPLAGRGRVGVRGVRRAAAARDAPPAGAPGRRRRARLRRASARRVVAVRRPG